MTVCISHGGQTMYRSDRPSTELLVGTADGVVCLERDGTDRAWRVGRTGLRGKHVSALMAEPSRGLIFAGTHRDGIFASEDEGRTWEARSGGVEHPNIYSLAWAQANGQPRLYAGTEPAHLYMSADLGASWRELPALRSVPSVQKWTFPGPPHEAHVKNFAFDPRSADVIYAGVEVGGAFKSLDAGATWRELSGFYEDVHRLVIPRGRPESVYLSSGDGLYFSQDAGETWTRLTDENFRIAYPDALIAHPDRDGLLFMAGAVCNPGAWRQRGHADPRIARSHDGGQTWELLESGLPDFIHGNVEAMSMEVRPGGFSLCTATTDGDVFFSEDDGEKWSTIASGLAPISKGGHWRGVGRLDGWQPAGAAAH